MRSLCVRNADDMQHVRSVLNDFFLLTENGYIHKRCDVEIEKYHAKSKSASESAKVRWSMKNQAIDANAMRTHTEGNANQEPLTNNQYIKPIVISDANNSKCPHDEILKLYHLILPANPIVREWTAKRQALLRTRWNEKPNRQSLEFWERFFNFVASCDFLVGKTGEKPFLPNLEWLITPRNFLNIREEKYINKGK
jgi:hypothetical protein